MPKKLPAPPTPPAPPPTLSYNPMARMLADSVRQAHGEGSADTLDRSEDIGTPRCWMSWGNIAFRRVVDAEFPLGRIVEFTGDENVGKSTAADQLLSQVQQYTGGLGVLADVERARERDYMASLGIAPSGLIWVKARTAEVIFDEIETICRLHVHYSTKAWVDALVRSGAKVGKVATEVFEVFDPADRSPRRTPTAKWNLIKWGPECRAALLRFQIDHGLSPTGIRDNATSAVLRPVVISPPPPNTDHDPVEWEKDALYHWSHGIPDPRCQPADAPLVMVWDSIGMTATEAELRGSARDSNPASAARVIGQNVRRLTQFMDDASVGLVYTNQQYSIIDFGGPPGMRRGPDKTQYGGQKLKHAKSIHLHLTRGKDIYRTSTAKAGGEPPVGHEVYVTCKKNRFGARGRRALYGLIYHRGAVDAYAIFHDLRDRNIIRTGGAWSGFTDPTVMGEAGLEDKNWQNGWSGLDDIMRDNPTLADIVRSLYLEGY